MPATFRVAINTSAEADIADLWDYIAQDDPLAATAFIAALEEQISHLERFPERCPRIPENTYLGTDLRHLLYGPYRTIFRLGEERVIILRVIHGARLFETAE